MSLVAARSWGRSQVILQHLTFNWIHTRGVLDFSGAKKPMWNSSAGISGVAWINSALRKRCLWPHVPSLPLAWWSVFTMRTGKHPAWDWADIPLGFILMSSVTSLLPLNPQINRDSDLSSCHNQRWKFSAFCWKKLIISFFFFYFIPQPLVFSHWESLHSYFKAKLLQDMTKKVLFSKTFEMFLLKCHFLYILS